MEYDAVITEVTNNNGVTRKETGNGEMTFYEYDASSNTIGNYLDTTPFHFNNHNHLFMTHPFDKFMENLPPVYNNKN
jgi:hypothetical protein